MIAQFSIIPLGTGASVSGKVAEAIKIVDKSGLDYRVTPMGTVVEGDLDEVLALIKKCHTAVLAQTDRVYTTISIDDRKGRAHAMAQKIASVEEKAGIIVKK
ncbi:MAG TPA: MTH1187 family thiamine-binding protein [Candidatus Omnitrophota bacterium]|nr:MTH1187 family thiamine-binding protein [Candidatus Omnitrophota bacterium]